MPNPPRPCIERRPDGRGCPRYAEPGDSRCRECKRAAVATGSISPGTTAEWTKARKIALRRAGYACERCGRTDAQSRAEGQGGLHVHHVDGRGVRARTHDQTLLEVRCPPCHRDTLKRETRPSFAEQTAAQARRRAVQQRG